MTDERFDLPKGYLSASSIGTLQTCPRQYYYRYIEGIVTRPGAALVTGKAVHRTFEEYYNLVISGAGRLKGAQYSDLADEACAAELESEDVDMTTLEKEELKPTVSGIATRYIDAIGTYIDPLATEEEFVVTMPCGVDVKGFLDLRHRLAANGMGIADYKITSKAWTIGRLRNSLQFQLYTALKGISDVQIHNITKTAYKPAAKKPEEVDGVTKYASNMQVLHHVFPGEVDPYLDMLVEQCALQITSGIFPPCSPDSWVCTPDWCGYWGMCRGRRY